MTQAEIDAIADEIAEQSSAYWIGINTRHEKVGDVWWFDLNSCYVQKNVDIMVDYLEARGLLERHPERPELVRVKERV